MTTTDRATFKFDVVAIATVNVTTAHGADAARDAMQTIEEIEPGRPVEADTFAAPDARFELTCVAPRGRAYLADTGTGGQWASLDADWQPEEFREPVTAGDPAGLAKLLSWLAGNLDSITLAEVAMLTDAAAKLERRTRFHLDLQDPDVRQAAYRDGRALAAQEGAQ